MRTYVALILALGACCLSAARGCSQVYMPLLRQQQEGGRALLAAQDGDAHGEHAHWNYEHHGLDWTGTCQSGKAQSPIAIPLTNATAALPDAGRARLEFGVAKGLHVINTGHGVQVEWDSLEGVNASVPVAGDEWGAIFDEKAATLANATIRQVPVTPLQIHWHSTNEHLVDGDFAPLELHIVTEVDNTTGAWVPEKCRSSACLAVFGVIVNFQKDPYAPGTGIYQLVADLLPVVPPTPVDDANATASGVPSEVAVLPVESGANLTGTTLDLTSLLPEDRSYVTYAGSLTTPPCTEGVQWHVFLTPKEELSIDQANSFMSEIVDGTGEQTTNRAVMPINNRTLLLSKAGAAAQPMPLAGTAA